MSDSLSVEEIIREAQQEGLFSNLPGKGKPLQLDTSPDALVNGLLKEANVKPEWVELTAEIERLMEQGERLLETYAAEAAVERANLGDAVAAAEEPSGAPATQLTTVAPRWRRWLAGLKAVAAAGAAPGAGSRANLPGQRGVDAFNRRRDDVLVRYAALLHHTNRKIRRFNQEIPLANRQRALLPVQEQLLAFTERFPHLVRTPDGRVCPTAGHVPAELLVPPSKDAEQPSGCSHSRADVLRVARRTRRR